MSRYLSLILILFGCASTTEKLQKRPIALVNNVSFIDSQFNNPNASNGFLVEYKDKTYAITAKHVMLIAKTDKMEFVDFEEELKQWKMHPKNDSTHFLLTDQLLNKNRKDLLTWKYLEEHYDDYNDWLVFSLKEDQSDYRPLKFRKKEMVEGEHLYAVGWTYKDTIGPQRVYEYKFDKMEGDYLNLIQVKGPQSLGGLSGSPVVDEEGNLAGLVSSGWEDENLNVTILQATGIRNIIQFLDSLD